MHYLYSLHLQKNQEKLYTDRKKVNFLIQLLTFTIVSLGSFLVCYILLYSLNKHSFNNYKRFNTSSTFLIMTEIVPSGLLTNSIKSGFR